ncbi:MAG: class I SAM-dependent methyltransferase [Acidobacteria bacterium]|nr:class I SAM-dependent methyltransferase [Acidobacteriota bacterium]
MGQVTAHYESVSEEARLRTGFGVLEFARSQEILLRYLPPAPAVVLDIGGAAGIYSTWLASLGYRASLLDLVYKHTALARAAGVTSVVQGDARALPYSDACSDAVLLMGPLYHLTERSCRVRALAEARRVLRPGGVVFAACICRYASLMAALALGLLDDSSFEPILRRNLDEGQHRNPGSDPLYFTTAYMHLPQELRDETEEAGFMIEDLLPVEGPGWLAKNFEQAWADETQKKRLLDIARRVEREPALTGVSPHLLAVGRRQ